MTSHSEMALTACVSLEIPSTLSRPETADSWTATSGTTDDRSGNPHLALSTVSAEGWRLSRWAAWLQAANAVCSGAVGSAFAVVRPPGHHAECARAMGFCFYNNVAVAALAARQQQGVDRVLVLDWDVHHGERMLLSVEC